MSPRPGCARTTSSNRRSGVDDGYLELADWRLRVAEVYAAWRHEAAADAHAATLRLRAQRDELFRAHPQSPLPATQRARFGGLSYLAYHPSCAYDPKWNCPLAPPESRLPMRVRAGERLG